MYVLEFFQKLSAENSIGQGFLTYHIVYIDHMIWPISYSLYHIGHIICDVSNDSHFSKILKPQNNFYFDDLQPQLIRTAIRLLESRILIQVM